MDLNALDPLGMWCTIAFELHRLHGHGPVSVAGQDPDAHTVVVDVSIPRQIERAIETTPVVKNIMEELRGKGISQVHPGFDILTIVVGQAERLIELKLSGVDPRAQAISWNEWQSAGDANLTPQQNLAPHPRRARW